METFIEFFHEEERLLTENHKDLLPSKGAMPYIAPRNAHGNPKPIRGNGREVYADKRGHYWQFDGSHTDPHWDVSNPNDKAQNAYIRVGTDGHIWEAHAPTHEAKMQLLLECGVDTATITRLLLG